MNSNNSAPSPTTQRIALTGGIGSGKSHVCAIIARTGAPIFYADPAAKHIIRTDPQVRAALTDLVGAEVYDAQGQLVKSVLAAFLCQGRAHSTQVDAIVHPRVEQAWRDFVSTHADAPYIYMECALLFEVGWQRLVDRTVLVSCPEEERIRRVMARDAIDRATACRWIALQMPEAEKARLADVVLINDGQAPILPQLEQYQLIPSSFSE